MPDLHGWITRQVDEAEGGALAATPGPWKADTDDDTVFADAGTVARMWDYVRSGSAMDVQADMSLIIAHADPTAVLRRCAADRKILEVHAPAGTECDPYACNGCGVDSEYGHEVDHTNDCPTLQALAEGYGLTEEQRAALDRPERERPVYPGKTGDVILDSIASMYAGLLLGTRPVESPKEKAMKILAPELKKIPGYVPTTEEQQ